MFDHAETSQGHRIYELQESRRLASSYHQAGHAACQDEGKVTGWVGSYSASACD